MPLDTTIDASAAALLGVIALERILPLISVVRAANDEGYETDLRTVTLAWELTQLGEQKDPREYSQVLPTQQDTA